ncbi:hypothetical protein SAMN06265222_102345 [Neorhodopirellula lusitana]|uniref:Uncharacterized protein n=1 Tax=Neorhodopirellula lusitana TaxID=445327 RepID=A0ABY1PX03_9BACT|nr:hypothetical protein SAMN06265222_102345 [Neorhodopirellula lusitana]
MDRCPGPLDEGGQWPGTGSIEAILSNQATRHSELRLISLKVTDDLPAIELLGGLVTFRSFYLQVALLVGDLADDLVDQAIFASFGS